MHVNEVLNPIRRFFLCERCCLQAIKNLQPDDAYFWAKHYIRSVYSIYPEWRIVEKKLVFDPMPRIVKMKGF